MEKTNFETKDIEKFCEDNFIDDDMSDKIAHIMVDNQGKIEVIPLKDDTHATLKIEIKLNEV